MIGPPSPYNYWWLRSPGTGDSGIAWYINPSGGVGTNGDGDVDYSSYGRTISPDSFMHYNYTSFYVMEDGSMITYAVDYFYRSIFDYFYRSIFDYFCI